MPISRPAFLPPQARPEWVDRSALLDRLARSSEARLVLVDAPVGYGKTTLLAQWALRDRETSFVWLSLEPAHSDPVRLLTHLIRSLEAAGLGGPMSAVVAPTQQAAQAAVTRILDDLRQRTERIVIVLDDHHVLRGQRVHQLVVRLITECPANVQVALGTRADPPYQLARMRATGELCEVRAADLEFDVTTAAAFFGRMGIALDGAQVDALVDRAEGWPAGLYLAALSLRDEPEPQHFLDRFTGSHRNIADYLSEEVLNRQSAGLRDFLAHTSILDRLCGPLCDTVLGRDGSQAVLEQLERSNLFVIALDESRDWFRYHHLFGQMLRADLARSTPVIADELHRRASTWFAAQGWYDDAIEHSLTGHDSDVASELIAEHWMTFFNRGRLDAVRSWLDRLGDEAVRTHPDAALTAAWLAALSGEPDQMERLLVLAERGPRRGHPAERIQGKVALVRGLFGFGGLDERRGQLDRARALEPPDSAWQAFISWGLGHVALMAGDPREAASHFRVATAGPASRQPVLAMITLAEGAVAELELGNLAPAQSLAVQAWAMVEQHSLQLDTRSSGALLALGRVAVARGDLVSGRQWLEDALRMRRKAGRLSPWPTMEVLLVLAPLRYQQGEVAAARALVDEARSLLDESPDTGDVLARLAAVERATGLPGRQVQFGQQLTERELLILRMFESSGSSREIGERLFLSVNTVKTHTRSIYRKLGVSSRDAALERAGGMELL